MTLFVLIFGGMEHTLCANTQPSLPGNEHRKDSCELIGNVINAITGLGLRDTIRVELLTPDSVVVNSVDTRCVGNNSQQETTIYTPFFIKADISKRKYILRLSNPDFETTCYDLNIPEKGVGAEYRIGTFQIRRLSRFEKAQMLGEVTVTASVIAIVNKGDTIQYNADAFEVAQGSMLDAIIEQLPGVELRDGGQLYVNGRFIDKLLLDGKDFFSGDKLILMKNLPAYTVKNIKVYEQANGRSEVFGKGATGTEREPYVMDVSLKKGYNAGWMANAEAGGGTHDRYRGRVFGIGYTDKLRLGVYGLINNLNENRNPGRNGNWNPSESRNGIMASRGGGMNYGFYRPDQTVSLSGNITAIYTHTDNNSIVNRQNYLIGEDTYSRIWNDNLARKLRLTTSHNLIIRPKDGNKYYTQIGIEASYQDEKSNGTRTEGTFGQNSDYSTDMRDALENGFPLETGLINRYLSYLASNTREARIGWNQNSTFAIGSAGHGITVETEGHFLRGRSRGTNDYILQYDGGVPEEVLRNNPLDNHGFRYHAMLMAVFHLNRYITLMPSYGIDHEYSFNSDKWLVDTISEDPSRLQEMAMRVDPHNSYSTGFHSTQQSAVVNLNYSNRERRNGADYKSMMFIVQFGANIIDRRLDFRGFRDQNIRKNYIEPENRFRFSMNLPGMKHSFTLQYAWTGSGLDLMDLVDATFSSDPLYIRTGAKNLKPTINHKPTVEYKAQNMFGGRFSFDINTQATFKHNAVTMAYSYDHATGVRTTRPENVNGTWSIWLGTNQYLFLDRAKKLKLTNRLSLQALRFVNLSSTNGFQTFTREKINRYTWTEAPSLEYSKNKYLLAVEGRFSPSRISSNSEGFSTQNVTTFNYGLRGRIKLPYNIEVSSDLKMYSTRGFDYNEINTNQLVWNGRVTKSLMKGSLMLALDGYDILGRVKRISYNVNEQGRTETWVNSIPSYVMLSLRWNFTKKPRE